METSWRHSFHGPPAYFWLDIKYEKFWYLYGNLSEAEFAVTGRIWFQLCYIYLKWEKPYKKLFSPKHNNAMQETV